jgi:hypothetical protein
MKGVLIKKIWLSTLKNFKFLFSITLFYCFPLAQTDKITDSEWTKLSKVKQFTIVVIDSEGKDYSNLYMKRAGLYFNQNEDISGKVSLLNHLYGQSFRRAFQKTFSYQDSQIPDFIPPEKLNLIYSPFQDKDYNRAWLASLGIDALVTIEQQELVLDYNTRVPDLGYFNFLYTFLLLDLWYIDVTGIWYLKNKISYTIQFTKTGKWYRMENQQKTEILGEFHYKNLDKILIEDAIMQTCYDILIKSWIID